MLMFLVKIYRICLFLYVKKTFWEKYCTVGTLNEPNTMKYQIKENMAGNSGRDVRFWFQITRSKSRAARGDHAIMLWPGGRRRGERQPEICLPNWWKLRWGLFSSSKTTKRAVRRYVKQSRPTVNRDHSHAWQLFPALLGCLPRYAPPGCVSNCLSSSSPSTSHNYSMKGKKGFSKTAIRSGDFTRKRKISWISGYFSVV